MGKEDFGKRGFWEKVILGKGFFGKLEFCEKGIWVGENGNSRKLKSGKNWNLGKWNFRKMLYLDSSYNISLKKSYSIKSKASK